MGDLGFLFIVLCGIYIFGALVFLSACIAFAPFAGFICAGYANRNKGLSVWRYAIVGAICSAFLLVPWVYLKMRMDGRPVSIESIKTTYILLHIFWASVIFINTMFITMLPNLLREVSIFNTSSLPGFTFLAISVSAWVISGKLLIHRRSTEDEETDNLADILPKFVYIMPFVYSSASVTALPLVILLFDLGLI